MATVANPNMTKRNLIWLAVIIIVGVIVGISISIVAGVIAGAAVLVVSELVERSARRKRQQAAPHVVDA
jgi:uncharacterized protein involved in cysteine biosynthesis